MLFELFDLNVEPRTAQIIAGALLGVIFGVAAQISRFCLRRAVAGPAEERASAGAVWLTALATAIFGYAVAFYFGLVDLGDHRFTATELPVIGLLVGGLAFGAGMVLTRGCISRLTVLSATGNLRAVLVLLIFAIVAHATMKGVLSPLQALLSGVSISVPVGSLAEYPVGLPLLLLAVTALAAMLAVKARPRAVHLVMGAIIGAVALGGWMATSVLLMDEFDPLPAQSAAFTLPWSDTLFWTIASTAIPATFGVGFIAGVLGGAFASAAARGELALQSFDSPVQTLRYGAGGVLMGVGGVLAGGCTVGTGLSGVGTGSIGALIALAAIVTGAWITANLAAGSRAAHVPA